MTLDQEKEGHSQRPRAENVTAAGVRHVRERLKGPIHQRLSLALQGVLLVGMVLAVWQQQWLTAVTTGAILVVTILPLVLGRRFTVYVPPEFEALTIVFVFASLFLGEVGGYYTRFWWWDAALHVASGFLLGIRVPPRLGDEREGGARSGHEPGLRRPFAFMFAVGMGALWEIFEFAMDSVFGMNMQKSGLVDTMWDLIVDTIGATVIAGLGYGWPPHSRDRFLPRAVDRIVRGVEPPPLRPRGSGDVAFLRVLLWHVC